MQAAQMRMMEAMERLRALGYKLTPQRCAMLRLFAQAPAHRTAQQLWSELERLEPEAKLSRATVYNTLEVLEQAGLVVRIVGDDGQTYYDPRVDPHHHAQCTACGALFDLELVGDAAPSALADAAHSALDGFAVASVSLWLRGVCAACQGRP
jgi:Fur family peroxide stress response transcriptional regulator